VDRLVVGQAHADVERQPLRGLPGVLQIAGEVLVEVVARDLLLGLGVGVEQAQQRVRERVARVLRVASPERQVRLDRAERRALVVRALVVEAGLERVLAEALGKLLITNFWSKGVPLNAVLAKVWLATPPKLTLGITFCGSALP
jgi:hypothetical protein